MIDSAIMRAYSQANGVRQKKGGLMPKGWVGLAAD